MHYISLETVFCGAYHTVTLGLCALYIMFTVIMALGFNASCLLYYSVNLLHSSVFCLIMVLSRFISWRCITNFLLYSVSRACSCRITALHHSFTTHHGFTTTSLPYSCSITALQQHRFHSCRIVRVAVRLHKYLWVKVRDIVLNCIFLPYLRWNAAKLLISKISPPLHAHLAKLELPFIQFSLKWCACPASSHFCTCWFLRDIQPGHAFTINGLTAWKHFTINVRHHLEILLLYY